jgi:hypothetical protein
MHYAWDPVITFIIIDGFDGGGKLFVDQPC